MKLADLERPFDPAESVIEVEFGSIHILGQTEEPVPFPVLRPVVPVLGAGKTAARVIVRVIRLAEPLNQFRANLVREGPIAEACSVTNSPAGELTSSLCSQLTPTITQTLCSEMDLLPDSAAEVTAAGPAMSPAKNLRRLNMGSLPFFFVFD